MRALRLGTYYFLIVFAIGFVLGVVRNLLLVPYIGDTAAVLLELPAILGAAWVVTGQLLRSNSLNRRGAAAMGAFAFGLLLLAEAALSIAVFDRTAREHLALYAHIPHLLGLAGQMLFATFPWLRVFGGPPVEHRRPVERKAVLADVDGQDETG